MMGYGIRGGDREKVRVSTGFVVLSVPVRVAGDVLGLLVGLLRVALEHLLEELELSSGEEGKEEEEDWRDDKLHGDFLV